MPIKIAGYAMNGPVSVRFNDTIVIAANILAPAFHQIPSAVEVFGDTSSDALESPIASYITQSKPMLWTNRNLSCISNTFAIL